MKKQNFFATTIFALSLTVIFAASTALAAETTVYVSATGKYVVDGVEHEAYTDLQEAVNAADAENAATIWVEDGYVFDSGSTNVTGTASRLYISRNKGLTISSRSGKWETGAEIRGAYHSDETPCGENSVRCLEINGKSSDNPTIKFIGVRFVGGSTTTSGGGINATAIAYNKKYQPIFENCLIASCQSKSTGGGVFRDNNQKSYCIITLDNCTISNCVSYSAGGGVYSNAPTGVNDAVFLTNSVIVCNIATNLTPYATTSAATKSGKTGGGLYKCEAVNSLIASNYACGDEKQKGNGTNGAGGGANSCILTGCVISNNVAWYRGGGVSGGEVINCIVVDNTSYSGGGGIASSLRIVGSLIARNKAIGTSGLHGGVYGYGADPACVIENSTIVNNHHYKSDESAVHYIGAMTNCVVWGNTRGKEGEEELHDGIDATDLADVFYSCFSNAVTDVNGNIAADPRLRTRDGKAYVATAAECRGKGVLVDWMSDTTSDLYCDYYGDVRSKNGAAPDMGWAVYKLNGFRIILK